MNSPSLWIFPTTWRSDWLPPSHLDLPDPHVKFCGTCRATSLRSFRLHCRYLAQSNARIGCCLHRRLFYFTILLIQVARASLGIYWRLSAAPLLQLHNFSTSTQFQHTSLTIAYLSNALTSGTLSTDSVQGLHYELISKVGLSVCTFTSLLHQHATS